MRILLVASGHRGIYNSFEEWIQVELNKKHEVIFFDFENGGMSSMQEIVHTFKPEVMFTLIGVHIPTIQLQWLKQQGIITAVWFTEDPYYIDQTIEYINYFNFVFTIDTAALEVYKARGHKQAYHLPLATNHNLFNPKEVDGIYLSDICLVGYPYPNRISFVQFLLQYTPYKIQIVGPWKHVIRKLRRYSNVVIHSEWVEPNVVANYYNGAKIVLNTHRPVNERHNQNKLGIMGKSINNRTFDVAACAAFQLIEFKDDLPIHFNENEEIVSFKNVNELIEKTHYYIQAEQVRRGIAKNGRERVLKNHTFQHRIDKMISIIKGFSTQDDKDMVT